MLNITLIYSALAPIFDAASKRTVSIFSHIPIIQIAFESQQKNSIVYLKRSYFRSFSSQFSSHLRTKCELKMCQNCTRKTASNRYDYTILSVKITGSNIHFGIATLKWSYFFKTQFIASMPTLNTYGMAISTQEVFHGHKSALTGSFWSKITL